MKHGLAVWYCESKISEKEREASLYEKHRHLPIYLRKMLIKTHQQLPKYFQDFN